VYVTGSELPKFDLDSGSTSRHRTALRRIDLAEPCRRATR
jgi:hypothetical protein